MFINVYHESFIYSPNKTTYILGQVTYKHTKAKV